MSSPLKRLREQGIEIRHYIPGRLRFSVHALRHNANLAGRIVSDLGQVPGVTRVECHPVSTSVLVLFDPGQLAVPSNTGQLLRTLQALFPGVAADVWNDLWSGRS